MRMHLALLLGAVFALSSLAQDLALRVTLSALVNFPRVHGRASVRRARGYRMTAIGPPTGS